jgi:hypothetical protein
MQKVGVSRAGRERTGRQADKQAVTKTGKKYRNSTHEQTDDKACRQAEGRIRLVDWG